MGLVKPDSPEEVELALEPVLVDGQLLFIGSSDSERLSIAAAYRGTQMTADQVGRLPWEAVRGGPHSDQGAKRMPELVDPKPPILVNPSPFHTVSELKRLLVTSLILRGNAYLWLTGVDPSTGMPTMAIPINPDEVNPQWKDPSKRLERVFWWRDQPHSPREILWIPMMLLPGALKGLGPFDAADRSLAAAVAAEEYATDLFEKGGTPSGTLMHPGKLTKPEADKLKAQWQASHGGTRDTAILGGGVSFEAISLTPEQSQFLQTRAFGNQTVATLLGIPEHLLNSGSPPGSASSLTYTNVQQVFSEWTKATLAPTYLARLEEAFTTLLPRGTTVRFDTRDFLRTDDQTRYTAAETAIRAGILTVDEVREAEGLGPAPSPPPAPAPTQEADPVEQDPEDEETIQEDEDAAAIQS